MKKSLYKISLWIPSVNVFLHIIVYLFVRSHGQVLGVSDSTSYMKVGESVQFPFTPIENHNYKVELVFNFSVVVVLWLPKISFLQTHVHYKERVNIQDNIISLERLQLSDSGFYDLNMGYFTGPQAQKKRLNLQVLEPVSKPSVTVDCQSGNLTLSCSSSEGSDVTYSWEILPPCGNSCFVQQGSVMEMKVKDGKGKKNYTCTAQNIVSRESSEPLDLDVCAHNVSGNT
ncbi:SLAM family member 5-like [Scleropages formosus]|uniref:SLAM family member 5-like n=1 Tax=Scleropages formosus TaxID=113540 RepID=UPI0010FAC668|nr:SLAM family member 5-like [Scleropages formosus]